MCKVFAKQKNKVKYAPSTPKRRTNVERKIMVAFAMPLIMGIAFVMALII